jgi:hypothetical protein
MFRFVLVVITIVSLIGAEPWPQKITVDALGVHWTDENGTNHFFENENALAGIGMVPFVRYIECEREGMDICSQYQTYCRNGKCTENLETPVSCVQLKCTAFPPSNLIQFNHDVIYAMGAGEALGPLISFSRERANQLDISFDPKPIRVTMKAVDSLSVLWHIR